MFRDRLDAARRLLALLDRYRGAMAVVLGIPRGGVPMAALIAEGLDAELDVLLVHKLPAPGNPELAIGAVDESGRVWLNPEAQVLGVPEEYISTQARRELERLEQRRERYSRGRPAIPLAGRTVIVVDDGVATGSTLIAGLRAVRHRRPARLAAAVGVAPTQTLQRLQREADQVVCAYDTDLFYAVGAFFRDFPPVSDEEVMRLLAGRQAPSSLSKDSAHA